jgi:ATP-binding cassette, subfamily C (CFTR/MRP), member 1
MQKLNTEIEIDQKQTPKSKQNHILGRVLIKSLWKPITAPAFSRAVLIAFTFCQPLLLKRLLGYLSNATERKDIKIGYGLIGAYGLVYMGIAVSDFAIFDPS